MAALGEISPRLFGKASFERHQTGLRGARVERTWHVLGMKSRALDRLLQIHAVINVMHEHQRRPLVLLIAAGSAESECRRTVLERHGRRQGAARALAGHQARWQSFFEPEHLHPRAEAKAELGNNRRALQPATRRRRRDDVGPAVDDIDMASVASDDAMPGHRGLAEATDGGLANAGAGDRGFASAD